MKIFFKSFLSVITTGRISEKTLELPEGTTAAQALAALGISPEEEILILVNKGICNENKVLYEGDTLTIMPPVSAA